MSRDTVIGAGSRAPVTGRTRLAAVIGHPVGHSLSPALHNAAFQALGLDWLYVAFDVAPGGGAQALSAMRALGIGGLNVTMPHKGDVAAAVDRLSPEAELLGAVNTVAWSDGVLVGHNTDGAGFLASLRADEGIDVAGARCLVLGAGGAARAVVAALAAGGAAEVVVVARRAESGAAAAALAPGVARVGTHEEVSAASIVVNATPVGMAGAGDATSIEGLPHEGLPVDGPPTGTPVDPGRLGPGQVVVDLVYDPVETALLAEASRRGARCVAGTGMLLHQAAASFRLWTHEDAPLDAMGQALRHALAGRAVGPAPPATDH